MKHVKYECDFCHNRFEPLDVRMVEFLGRAPGDFEITKDSIDGDTHLCVKCIDKIASYATKKPHRDNHLYELSRQDDIKEIQRVIFDVYFNHPAVLPSDGVLEGYHFPTVWKDLAERLVNLSNK